MPRDTCSWALGSEINISNQRHNYKPICDDNNSLWRIKSRMSRQSPSYADCVCSLRTSLAFLESSVATLDNGVQDFPRLCHVLRTVRVRPPLAPYSSKN